MGCSASKHAGEDVAAQAVQARPVQASAGPELGGYPSRPHNGNASLRQPVFPSYAAKPGQITSHHQERLSGTSVRQTPFPLNGATAGISPVQDIWPKRISIADAGVDVLVWHHANNTNSTTGPCTGWIYLSNGLLKINQPEVIFRLRQRPTEAASNFPNFPIEWIRIVHEFAQNGVHLDEGQMCQIVPGDPTRFVIGRREVLRNREAWSEDVNLSMFVHTPAPGWDGVYDMPRGFKIPKAVHHVVSLTAEEAAVALEFGPTRVISHLGLSVRCFPAPAWVERDREDCCTMADQTNSGRSKFKLARIYGITALLTGGFASGTIVLSLPPGEKKKNGIQAAFRNLSQEMMFGFDAFMSEQADSGLTWKSGQKDAQAYGKGSYVLPSTAILHFKTNTSLYIEARIS